VLVVGRDSATLIGLMLSKPGPPPHRPRLGRDRPRRLDYEGRASWVRLDRVLDVPRRASDARARSSTAPPSRLIAARLRAEYSWS